MRDFQHPRYLLSAKPSEKPGDLITSRDVRSRLSSTLEAVSYETSLSEDFIHKNFIFPAELP